MAVGGIGSGDRVSGRDVASGGAVGGAGREGLLPGRSEAARDAGRPAAHRVETGALADMYARQARRALSGDDGAQDRFSMALFGVKAEALDEGRFADLSDLLFDLSEGSLGLSVRFVPESALKGAAGGFIPGEAGAPGTLLVSRALADDPAALRGVLGEGFGAAVASYAEDGLDMDLAQGPAGARLSLVTSGQALRPGSALFDAGSEARVTVRHGGRSVSAVVISGKSGARPDADDLSAVQTDVAREARTDSGWRGLVLALTGRRLRDLPPAQQDALAQLRSDILDGTIAPSVETVPRGTPMPGQKGTMLPEGVDGAYVPGAGGEPGRILLADDLTPEERAQTLAEEFGEAVAEAARGLGVKPAAGDAGERLRRAVAGEDVHPDNPATRTLFADAPEDEAEVLVDGKRVTVEADASTLGLVPADKVDLYLDHLFAADGYFSDSTPNGMVSAGELEIAFSYKIDPDRTSSVPHFTKPGNNTLSEYEKAEIAALVDHFGTINPATQFMALDRATLRSLITSGTIGVEMSGLYDRYVTVRELPASARSALPDEYPDLTLQEAYQVAKNLPPAEIEGIVSEYGTVGLISYIAQLMDIILPAETIKEIAEGFAIDGSGHVSASPYGSTLINTAAMAFSAVMLGNRGYAEGLEVFRTAVRSDFGLEQSDHGVGRWAEYVFMGSRDKANETDKGATAQTEFARSFLSVGRTVVAETEGEAAAAALDSAAPTDNAAIPGSEKLEVSSRPVDTWPRERDDADPEDPYEMNEDGTYKRPNPDYYRYEDVTKLKNDRTRRVDGGPMLELVDVTDEEVDRLGLKAVLVRTDRDSVAADDLKEIEWTEQETIRNLVNDGYRVSYIRAHPKPMAIQTSAAVSDPLMAEAYAPREYGKDGRLLNAGPSARIAQYYHNTQFEAVRHDADDPENIAPAEWDIGLVSRNKGYSDHEAIRLMLNELGLSDGDINTLIAEVQSAAAGMSSIEGPTLSQHPGFDIVQDFLTGGLSTLFKNIFPGDGHPWTDFARSKLKAAGRSTAQADQMAAPFEGSKIDADVLTETIAFLILDLAGADVVTSAASAASKAIKAGRKLPTRADDIADATRTAARSTDSTTSTTSEQTRPTNPDQPDLDTTNSSGGTGEIQPAGPKPPSAPEPKIGDRLDPVDDAAEIDRILSSTLQSGPHKGATAGEILRRAEKANWLVNTTSLPYDGAEYAGELIHISKADDATRAQFIRDLELSGAHVQTGAIPAQSTFRRAQLKGGAEGTPQHHTKAILAEHDRVFFTPNPKKPGDPHSLFIPTDHPQYEAYIKTYNKSLEQLTIVKQIMRDANLSDIEKINSIDAWIPSLIHNITAVDSAIPFPRYIIDDLKQFLFKFSLLRRKVTGQSSLEYLQSVIFYDPNGGQGLRMVLQNTLDNERHLVSYGDWAYGNQDLLEIHDELLDGIFDINIDGQTLPEFFTRLETASTGIGDTINTLNKRVFPRMKEAMDISDIHRMIDSAPGEKFAQLKEYLKRVIPDDGITMQLINDPSEPHMFASYNPDIFTININQAVDPKYAVDITSTVLHEMIHARQHIYAEIYQHTAEFMTIHGDMPFDEATIIFDMFIESIGVNPEYARDAFFYYLISPGTTLRHGYTPYVEQWLENEAWSFQREYLRRAVDLYEPAQAQDS